MARRNVNIFTCKTVEFTDSLFKQVPSLLNGIIYEGEYGNAVLNLHKVIFSWMMGSYFNVILCGTLGKRRPYLGYCQKPISPVIIVKNYSFFKVSNNTT